MDNTESPSPSGPGVPKDVYRIIGLLTRQLHDALNELGFADQLRGTVDKLPDAKSRLSYIARLTGEAAEKVLTRVELAKSVQDGMAAETENLATLMKKDPVKAVASGAVMNYIEFIKSSNASIDQHLTEIMMAQDFHDLTGQVISRVVNLATTIEDQLVHLLIKTAPPNEAGSPVDTEAVDDTNASPLETEHLAGPVVDPEGRSDIVTDQSQVDDLLASLGF
jgi:chemotaxis protein CheZ